MDTKKSSINTQSIQEETDKMRALRLKRIELKELERRYKITRKAAKAEEKLDFEGEEDVPVTGREAFYQVLKKSHQLDKLIDEKDLALIKNALYTHPEFVDKDKIKFILDVAYKRGGLAKVEDNVNEFLSLFRDTIYLAPLQQFKKWLKVEKTSAKIADYKKRGFNTNQIAEKLNITSAEVKVFSNHSSEMPELFDDKTR